MLLKKKTHHSVGNDNEYPYLITNSLHHVSFSCENYQEKRISEKHKQTMTKASLVLSLIMEHENQR